MQDKMTEQAAYDLGAKGAKPTELERMLFEAWMRGHCWKVCGTWDGTTYIGSAEQGEYLDPHAMRTRQLWAAWRDRGALAAPQCLLQIQEPATKPQALAHYSQQASLAMGEAAHAAVAAAAPVVLPEPCGVIVINKDGANATYHHGVKDKESFESLFNSALGSGPYKSEFVYTEQQVRSLLAGVSAPAAQAVEPFGYVNTHTGQFFKNVEPCRKTNEGHWRTVFTAPQAQADARDAESDYQRGFRHGYNSRDAEVQGALL